MSKSIDGLKHAIQRGMTARPEEGGFPFLAASLHDAGVLRNEWFLPSCQSIYITREGAVMAQATPLLSGFADVAVFDPDALKRALRADQRGQSTFREFLQAIWDAGTVRYEIDFASHTVTYWGVEGETFTEEYPALCLLN